MKNLGALGEVAVGRVEPPWGGGEEAEKSNTFGAQDLQENYMRAPAVFYSKNGWHSSATPDVHGLYLGGNFSPETQIPFSEVISTCDVRGEGNWEALATERICSFNWRHRKPKWHLADTSFFIIFSRRKMEEAHELACHRFWFRDREDRWDPPATQMRTHARPGPELAQNDPWQGPTWALLEHRRSRFL